MIIGGVIAAGALFGGKFYFNGGANKATRDLTDNVIVITGANTGIGKETALVLARHKTTLVLACRDQQRTQPAIDEIIKETGNQNVEFMQLDLGDLESVKAFAKNFRAKYARLDMLINFFIKKFSEKIYKNFAIKLLEKNFNSVNNAGIMALPNRTLSKQGYELQFATNHIGHFYLTNLLLDLLKSSGKARIINVSSLAHERGKMNWDDLQYENNYQSWAVYSQSKLANVVFTKELAKRLQGTGVTSYSLHPGVVRTELARNLPLGVRISQYIMFPFYWYFTKSSSQGAQTTLHCALEDESKLTNGGYYADCALKKNNVIADSEENCKKLWEITESLIASKIENPYKI